MEGLRIGAITEEEIGQQNPNTITIVLSKERFEKLDQFPVYDYGLVALKSPTTLLEALQVSCQLANDFAVDTIDKYVKIVLTHGQYLRALKANNQGCSVRFIRATSHRKPE